MWRRKKKVDELVAAAEEEAEAEAESETPVAAETAETEADVDEAAVARPTRKAPSGESRCVDGLFRVERGKKGGGMVFFCFCFYFFYATNTNMHRLPPPDRLRAIDRIFDGNQVPRAAVMTGQVALAPPLPPPKPATKRRPLGMRPARRPGQPGAVSLAGLVRATRRRLKAPTRAAR